MLVPGSALTAAGVKWFGEVTDYRFDNVMTYTYMGTGASSGSGAAYMRNMQVQLTNSKTPFIQQAIIPEKQLQCYSATGSTFTGGSWGSNFRYGGTGAFSLGCY